MTVPIPAFPRPQLRYDPVDEAQFRSSVEQAIQAIDSAITEGIDIVTGDITFEGTTNFTGTVNFSGTVNLPAAAITEAMVTQHEAALSIGWAQLTDVPSTFTPSAHTHPFTEITGTIADAQVPASAVTQHEAALTILESQITDGSVLARLAADETITGTWTFPTTGIYVGALRLNELTAESGVGVDAVITNTDGDERQRIRFLDNNTLAGMSIGFDFTTNFFTATTRAFEVFGDGDATLVGTLTVPALDTSGATDLSLGTNGSVRVTIDGSNGYVGVLDTTPSYPLDVTGGLRATATSYFNASLFVDADLGINWTSVTEGQKFEAGDTGTSTLRFDAIDWRIYTGRGAKTMFRLESDVDTIVCLSDLHVSGAGTTALFDGLATFDGGISLTGGTLFLDEIQIYTAFYDQGSVSTGWSPNWALGNMQKGAITGGLTLTVDTASMEPGSYVIQLKNTSGSARTLTVSGVDLWLTSAPTTPMSNNTTTVIQLMAVEAYNGTTLRVIGTVLADQEAL